MKKTLLVTVFLLLVCSEKTQAYEEPVAGLHYDIKCFKEQEEFEILCRITEAEVTGGDIDSKKNVVSVVLNRVNSPLFPNNIKDVVFQKNQFSPVWDKRYWKVEISKETRKAVIEVKRDGPTTDALYFANLTKVSAKIKRWFDKLEFLFTDSVGHSFFK